MLIPLKLESSPLATKIEGKFPIDVSGLWAGIDRNPGEYVQAPVRLLRQ